jgi:hypothetical protein
MSLLFLWFGAFGLAGQRGCCRAGSTAGRTARALLITLGAMALSLLLWPLGAWACGSRRW